MIHHSSSLVSNRPAVALLSFVAALAAGCARQADAPTVATTTAATKNYYIDVHEFGPGKVKAADVAKAHQADLAAQGKHDVRFLQYWVDEAKGAVYCLSEAKDPSSIVATHREAHGLLPAQILEVAPGVAQETKGTELYLDVHELGAGNVSAAAVAAAHQKDLAVEGKHGVHFINYWVDEASGRVFCLSEAPSADAVRETHREAHGLLPASVAKVTRGD